MQATNTESVLQAIAAQGGVYMFGRMLPIWKVILVEFCFAYVLECFIGSPMSFKMASKMLDPRTTQPMMFETVLICCTATIMCPLMSFFASCFYYPYYDGFNVLTLLANWLKLVCFNFPFACCTQIFFIQPLIRSIFAKLFAKDIQARSLEQQPVKVQSEAEAIADIMKRMEKIKTDLEYERGQRKKLEKAFGSRTRQAE
jgi:hypothetical protein